MSEPPTEVEALPPLIREDLVKTAVRFLGNPNVIQTSLAEQQKFLRRKGLTDEEIRVACEKSGAYTHHEQKIQSLPPAITTALSLPQQTVELTVFQRIRELVHNVAIFSVVAYIVNKFYQKYIAPFLFGRKTKSIEESIEDLDSNLKQSVSELRNDLVSVKVEVDKLSQGGEASRFAELKQEIATVKGLLLNRSQFPSVSKRSVIRPSIPEWQKTSISQDSDSDPDHKGEDLLEVGSGSGSEHEQNTKNSDSSLDIISFSSKDSDFRRLRHKDDVEDEAEDKN